MPLLSMNALMIPRRRSRPIYAFAAALVVGTGLLWRSGMLPLSGFVAKYGGDALWALVVFCGLGFLFRHGTTLQLALGTVGIAWSVEFLQLYHAPWSDALRTTRLGHLIIGTSFNSPDLIAYAIGGAMGAFIECISLMRTKKPTDVA